MPVKLMVVIVSMVCLHLPGILFSQKITISEKNIPIVKVLNSIQVQSGFEFFYDNKQIKQAGNISINIKEVALENALNQLFKNQPFTYSIVDKTIVIRKTETPVIDNIKSFITAPIPTITRQRYTYTLHSQNISKCNFVHILFLENDPFSASFK